MLPYSDSDSEKTHMYEFHFVKSSYSHHDVVCLTETYHSPSPQIADNSWSRLPKSRFLCVSDSPDIRAVALCSTQHGFVVVLWMSSTPREKMCMRMTTYFTFYDLSKLYSFRLCLKVQSSKNIHLSFLASVPAVERSPGSWNDEWGLLLFMVLSYPCSFSRICEDLPMKSRSSWSTSIPQMIRWSDRRHSKLKSEMAISFYPPPWRFFSHPLLVAFPLD